MMTELCSYVYNRVESGTTEVFLDTSGDAQGRDGTQKTFYGRGTNEVSKYFHF